MEPPLLGFDYNSQNASKTELIEMGAFGDTASVIRMVAACVAVAVSIAVAISPHSSGWIKVKSGLIVGSAVLFVVSLVYDVDMMSEANATYCSQPTPNECALSNFILLVVAEGLACLVLLISVGLLIDQQFTKLSYYYRMKTALIGMRRLATLSPEEKRACVDAYKFLQGMQAGHETKTEDETKAVAAYYKVLNNMLSIFDLEKLYLPPQLNEFTGLYGNQLLCEQAVLQELALEQSETSHLLDMGCGRGRISHHFASITGGQVSGYNIDPNQIENAVGWAVECGMSDQLHFKVGNHHDPLEYDSETFDGCFSFQAVWPFFKKEELDSHAREMFRVLKPGARYACSEYLLTPHFDWMNEEHTALHKLFLPTLAATHSMYPADVCAALERAGFNIVLSAPSKGPAWPLAEQKRDLILIGRKIIRMLEAVRILPPWVEKSLELLQTGGQAWTDAEKAKLADLNWRIVAEKPR